VSLNVPNRLDIPLDRISEEDRLSLMRLGISYLQSIIVANDIVGDKLTNRDLWSEARRATINQPSETTMVLRKELEAVFRLVLGPISVEDFDTTFLAFMLGRHNA
jgi:hypothetical protein